MRALMRLVRGGMCVLMLVVEVACLAQSAFAQQPIQAIEPRPYHYTFGDRAGGLMIETACESLVHGSYVSFDLDFPAPPNIVINGLVSGMPLMACAVNHTPDGFTLSLYDHTGAVVTSPAWVSWIAVYPSNYTDPETNWHIQSGCAQFGDDDPLFFYEPFDQPPVVVTSAQRGSHALTVAPLGLNTNGCFLRIQDQDGLPVQDAWVFWIAVSPAVFADPYSSLRVEASCVQRDSNGWVGYSLDFPAPPVAVTCAQKNGEPFFASSVNLTSDGFTLHMKDHSWNNVSSAWTMSLSVYPTHYDSDQPATIGLDTYVIDAECKQGQNAPDQAFEIWDAGVRLLDYTITPYCRGSYEWHPYGERYAIIVVGGDTEDSDYQRDWGDAYETFYDLLDAGFAHENVYFVAYGQYADDYYYIVDAKPSTQAAVQGAFQWAAANCTADDLLYVYWAGPGQADGFTVYDGTITPGMLAEWVGQVSSKRTIGAYSPGYSGAVIAPLSADNVISATAQDSNNDSHCRWATYWRRAMEGGYETAPSDTDGDGVVSMTEAFEWACPRAQNYGDHPQFDDNGDAFSHECDDLEFDPDMPYADGFAGCFYSLDGWATPGEQGWLSCEPASGQSTGEHDTITVHFDSAGLEPGTYVANIFVEDPNATNNPQIINVMLTVNCVADLNGDGTTDLSDLAILLASYNCEEGDDCYVIEADFDEDGIVDLSDLAVLLADYGCTRP